jgi:hypothetical protein
MDHAPTLHARKRLQQRAIPGLVVELLLSNGSTARRQGADVFFVDKDARKRLRRELGGDRGLKMIEPWLGHYLVVSDDGQLITAAPRTERIKRA